MARREPNPHDEATLARPAFARDMEKILNVPAYNRYADKTQVFSFVENDDITPARRCTCSWCARIARGIGAASGAEPANSIEAIALGHDVGHTPFGHAGERLLGEVLPRAHRALLSATIVHSACACLDGSCTAAT